MRPKEPLFSKNPIFLKSKKAAQKDVKAGSAILDPSSHTSAQVETHTAYSERFDPAFNTDQISESEVESRTALVQTQAHMPRNKYLTPKVAPTPAQDSTLYSILQKQNNITSSLVK